MCGDTAKTPQSEASIDDLIGPPADRSQIDAATLTAEQDARIGEIYRRQREEDARVVDFEAARRRREQGRG
ncbi:hypothetical protein GCM10027267_11330 [Paramicrobacterium agarici]